MDIAAGLFALAGVALAGAISEFRSWREARQRRADAIFQLRQETYSRALRAIEALYSKVAKWAESGRTPEDQQIAWDAITAATNHLTKSG